MQPTTSSLLLKNEFPIPRQTFLFVGRERSPVVGRFFILSLVIANKR